MEHLEDGQPDSDRGEIYADDGSGYEEVGAESADVEGEEEVIEA